MIVLSYNHSWQEMNLSTPAFISISKMQRIWICLTTLVTMCESSAWSCSPNSSAVNFLWHDVKLNNLPEPHLSLQPSKRERLAEHGRQELSMSSAVWTIPTLIPKQNDTKTFNHDCFRYHGIDVFTLFFASAHSGWNKISNIWSHPCLSFAGEVLPFLSLNETPTDVFFIPRGDSIIQLAIFLRRPKMAQKHITLHRPRSTLTALGISRISGIEFSILSCNFGFNTSQLARLPS